MKQIVKDNPNFIRDSESKAILNTNLGGLQEYKMKKQMQSDIENLKLDHIEVKRELDTIKDLLIMISNKIG